MFPMFPRGIVPSSVPPTSKSPVEHAADLNLLPLFRDPVRGWQSPNLGSQLFEVPMELTFNA